MLFMIELSLVDTKYTDTDTAGWLHGWLAGWLAAYMFGFLVLRAGFMFHWRADLFVD